VTVTSPPTFAIKTFGCKVNQYDSQLLAEELVSLGLAPAEASAKQAADVVVINTCAVTVRSEAKARRYVRRLLRESTESNVVVAGCAVRRSEDEWAELAAGSDGRLLSAGRLEDVAEALVRAGLLAGPAPGEADFPASISTFTGHDRAFVKVQDGCQSFCSYCIVPYVRPGLWSKPCEDVVEEVTRLSEAGYGEIVLSGVHLGLYGSDSDSGVTLAGLLRRLLAETDVGRLRLSSIEPDEVTDELIELAAGSRRLCPHFHLPLQSGDDRVLAAMNRRYTAHEYLRTLERIVSRIDRPSLTTDLMVGFPGEDDEAFQRTCAVSRRAGFSRVHVFRYSPRPGTRAAGLPGQPPERVAKERQARLTALAGGLARVYRAQFIGETVEVVGESTQTGQAGVLQGLSERYLRVRFSVPAGSGGRGLRPGSLLTVVVEGEDERGLVGRAELAGRIASE